jgi:crotonobetainyl-CoA:carnitine CoA-transferase CaiB-like acyl-CoA transferase
MHILGVDDDRFSSFEGRVQHRDELEARMREWCAVRTRAEVIAVFEKAEAAIGPVYDMADIAKDEHFAYRHAVTTVGDTPMQNLIARLSATPGVLHHEGRPLDADGAEIRDLGWTVFEQSQETS